MNHRLAAVICLCLCTRFACSYAPNKLYMPSGGTASTSNKALISSFWSSPANNINATENNTKIIAPPPSDENLDVSGPLPPNAYRKLCTSGSSASHVRNIPGLESNHKESCVLTLSLDMNMKDCSYTDSDMEEMVRRMHVCIDHGFNSFQIRSSDDDSAAATTSTALYGMMQKKTPSSLIQKCVLGGISVKPPGAKESWLFGADVVRNQISSALLQTGTDCLDSVHLHYDKNSPYHLETLDLLRDMQREGKILSISGRDMPTQILDDAKRDLTFQFDSNQVVCNVVDQRKLNDAQPHCMEKGMNMWISRPLMGGLLSNRYLEEMEEPLPSQLTKSQKGHIKVIRKWAKDGKELPWRMFHRHALNTLADIASKYEVSIAAVALRWAVEMEGAGSVVVGTQLLSREDSSHRPRALRDVFRFALDEKDKERIKVVAQQGTTGIAVPMSPYEEEKYLYELEKHRLLSNKSLWI